MKPLKTIVSILFVGCLISCAQNRYVIRSIESTHVAIDSAYDSKACPEMALLVEHYKKQLATEMDVPIGVAAQTLQKGYPQSPLSNFTADAMQETGERLWGTIDFAVMNMGGLRASLHQGTITIGSIYEICPFDNQLVLLELPGKAVKDFFDFIAFHGGQGLSKNIRLVIKKREVESLEINGNALDEHKIYRIVTIDYLAEGNDGMTALKQAVRQIDANETLRNVMIEYVKMLTANKVEANATIDHRITIK